MTSLVEQIQQFMGRKGKLVAQIIAAILALLALFLLAKLVWLWVEHLQPKPALEPVMAVTAKPVQKVNVETIVAKHLFGEANKAEPEQVVTEETRLNLKLMGTFVSEIEENSAAIIQSNGREKAYAVGDKLEVGGEVLLHQVETQKVIIKNNGRFETLTLIENINPTMIEQAVEEKEEVASDNNRVIDKRRDARLSQDLGELREKLYTSPQSLAGLANFERVIDDTGMVTGYKVSPGKDPRMFARLGLRRNDVVRSINGSQLNEQGYLGIIDELNSAESLEVVVERNGQPITLRLNVSQPENSTESNSRQEHEIQ